MMHNALVYVARVAALCYLRQIAYLRLSVPHPVTTYTRTFDYCGTRRFVPKTYMYYVMDLSRCVSEDMECLAVVVVIRHFDE